MTTAKRDSSLVKTTVDEGGPHDCPAVGPSGKSNQMLCFSHVDTETKEYWFFVGFFLSSTLMREIMTIKCQEETHFC